MGGRCDAIVIGAGVIGASLALALARAGRRTLNIDRLPAVGYGSTSSSCAIIRTHYSTLEGSAIAWEGYFCWKDWAGYLGSAGRPADLAEFRETGCLVMKTADNLHMEKIRANMDALGVPYEDWDRARIARRLPHYDLRLFAPVRLPGEEGFGEPGAGEIAGAVYFPHAGYVTDPQLAARNLADAARARGAEFRFNARVVSILKDGRGRVAGVALEDGETIAAPVVVNVAGPHSAAINAMAGALGDMALATRALKQEVAHLPAPVEGWDETGLVTSDGDVGCYTRPERGGHLLVGSEDPPCDPRIWADPDDWDASVTEQSLVQAMRMAQRIPALAIPNSPRAVVALYDVSDDWIPIYDRSCVPGFYMAVGTSGNQFKNAPVVGPMMAALIEACEAGRDHDRDPLRFCLERTGRDIDVGFYSRLRNVNPESSFSVLG